MFQDKELQNHLETSATIKSHPTVIAEWNLNIVDNIDRVGNYRNRPLAGPTSAFTFAPSAYDPLDEGNFYTNATNSDIVLDGGVDSDGEPILLKTNKDKEKLLFSLEDCFGRFRPRSGINKVRYGITPYIHFSNKEMTKRPRYYIADKNDKFKYWSSYRTENGIEYGIANESSLGHINDAAPFVVYKSPIAANRIVLKMQTNVGTVNLAPFFNFNGEIVDPFFGDANKTTPSKWHVDVLINGVWQRVKTFNPGDIRADGTAIIPEDGYVELAYGLIIPERFATSFVDNGEISSTSVLPIEANFGDAFLVKEFADDLGVYYIWGLGGYERYVPQYGWYLGDQAASQTTSFVRDLGNPLSFYSPALSSRQYREIQYISGIRVVVDQMNKIGSTFDLIEMSPRLVADITDITESFSVSKIASDLGNAGLPVGQLLASTGSIELFDVSQAFLETNPQSLIPKNGFKNMQVKFYETIYKDRSQFYVPIKTLYSENFPEINSTTRSVSIELRDFFFYLESISAPEIILTNTSLSQVVATLLDYIGFSNYTFKRLDSESEDIIPFFFTNSESSVAEVLQQLAVSTQTAMFFDEYNNFVCMSKGYMMPLADERETDITLIGTADFVRNGVIKNQNVQPKLANIADLSSQADTVFNDGVIKYNVRYIQKSVASSKQTYMLDNNMTWVYKPVTLWQVSGTESIKAQNEQKATNNAYALTAIPLNSDLTADIPTVVNGEVINNVIDFGEAVYFMDKYNGYFYANGEVIKYDAIEYSISGIPDPVWISSIDEYQDYFSKIPFNGKMYATGRVRIFVEPNYKTVDGVTFIASGAVAKHGRGQFGTAITAHSAGLASSWTDGSRLNALGMNASFIFDTINSDQEVLAVASMTTQQKQYRTNIIQKKAAIKVLREELNALTQKLALDPSSTSVQAEIASVRQSIQTAENQVSDDMKALAVSLQSSSKFFNAEEALKQGKRAQVTGKIKSYLSYAYQTENQSAAKLSTETQQVQASALIIDGAASTDTQHSPINHLTYLYKNIETQQSNGIVNSSNLFTHFGTRMRILGKVTAGSKTIETYGSMPYLTVQTDNPNDNPTISGGSGGVAGLLNSATGEGYYFEIVALDSENVEKYGAANVFFYKMLSSNPQLKSDAYSMPELLWRGMSTITTDSGEFTGQSRVFAQDVQTVYDLAFEYSDNVDGTRTFYLYLNGVQIGTVVDQTPITPGPGVAVFSRGTSKCMFENIYSLSHNYANNPSLKLSPVINSAFGTSQINTNDSFSKYAISGLVQSTYLSSISSSEPPRYNIFYEEFGTIMREAAYFNVKYDKAYPALYARLTPTKSKLKSYIVSAFHGGAYGAEFLVFNSTDTVLVIDDSSANPLSIQGITFTNSSENDLTVDEYFGVHSNLSNIEQVSSAVATAPTVFKEKYQDIKNSRNTYGRNEFSIDTPYVQSRDAANKMMSWLSERIMKPRKSLGLDIFSIPTLQLGDIVEVEYNVDNVQQVSFDNARFVVYQIDYSRDSEGPSMNVYLSEV